MKTNIKKLFTIYLSGVILLSLANFVTVKSASRSDTRLSVSVSDFVTICKIKVLVKPEKRIPRENNWGTLLTLEIFKPDKTKVGILKGRSNDQGIAELDPCAQGVNLLPGNYNFYIRGLSHLRMYFPNIYIDTSTAILDFSKNNKELFAGETSNIFDNKINSLDTSTQIRAFYRTDDEKNDLNRDGKVNALDFSNTVFNFYKLGDDY